MLIKICESKVFTKRAIFELLCGELKRGIPNLFSYIYISQMSVGPWSKFQNTIIQYYKLVPTLIRHIFII